MHISCFFSFPPLIPDRPYFFLFLAFAAESGDADIFESIRHARRKTSKNEKGRIKWFFSGMMSYAFLGPRLPSFIFAWESESERENVKERVCMYVYGKNFEEKQGYRKAQRTVRSAASEPYKLCCQARKSISILEHISQAGHSALQFDPHSCVQQSFGSLWVLNSPGSFLFLLSLFLHHTQRTQACSSVEVSQSHITQHHRQAHHGD